MSGGSKLDTFTSGKEARQFFDTVICRNLSPETKARIENGTLSAAELQDPFLEHARRVWNRCCELSTVIADGYSATLESELRR